MASNNNYTFMQKLFDMFFYFKFITNIRKICTLLFCILLINIYYIKCKQYRKINKYTVHTYIFILLYILNVRENCKKKNGSNK